MACDIKKVGGKITLIACSRGGRKPPKRCVVCLKRDATKLCDGRLSDEPDVGTCDKPLCAGCARSPSPGVDYCPTCADAARSWSDSNAV